jgi:hypothetical protein
MSAIVVLLASLFTAYLAGRLSSRAAFTAADLLVGVVGGLIGLSVAQYLGTSGASWGIGLPLLVACGLTLGLSRSSTARR